MGWNIDKKVFDNLGLIIRSVMKLILKSYYKNSGMFKEGDYVKPVPSCSPKKEIEAFLLEKLRHESLGGNYSKSELEYIEENLSESPEYAEAKVREGKFDWTAVFGIGMALLLLLIFIVLVKKFFGWIVFFAVLGLIGFPLSQRSVLPRRNVAISLLLVGIWIATSTSNDDDAGNSERAGSQPTQSSVCAKIYSEMEIDKRFRTLGSTVLYKQYAYGDGCRHSWHYSVIDRNGNSLDCFPVTDGASGEVELVSTSCEVN